MKKTRSGRAASAAVEDPTETRGELRAGESLTIVGIGASAGGLEAFSALLKELPLDTGMGFVLVQHLDPEHESALTQLLGRATSLPVHEVTNNLRVEPNQVYVIPPNTNLGIADGVLTLRPRPKTRTPHRSIDFFLEALAEDQRERAVGVILSGTATDGTVGLEAIKAEGGITFAQDDSARYDSMPRSAVAAGCVDFVMSPEDIAHEIARIAKHPAVARAASGSSTRAEDDRAPATTDEDDATPLPSGGHGAPPRRAERARTEAAQGGVERPDARAENGLKKILLLLRNHSGVDFSLYKSATIQRRITRRMVLSKQNTPEDYAQFLQGNAKELDALYSDVLIRVTSFFRNPDAFDVLQRTVFPALLQQRSDDPLRVWVLGCSTGQEAYSIAMAFVEASDKPPRMRKLQVFATDLNDALLEKARHGLYAKSLAQDLSPERLRRFFVEEEGGYRVSKSLREMVVFARQNVIADPPFSRMDVISCRNLLIYFDTGLQKKIFPVFHYALKPGGFLFLGASESISGFTDLFEPVDKKHKIYARKAAPTPAFQLPARHDRERPARGSRHEGRPLRMPLAPGGGTDAVRAELSAQHEADRVTVHQFAPPAVLINAELQILQFRGPTGAYLEPPSGKASFDILKMARNGLMLPLRTAINKAKKANKPVRKEHVRVEQDGQTRTVNVEVIPLKNLRERCFLVVFEDAERTGSSAARSRAKRHVESSPARANRAAGASESRRTAALEAELAETREYLQSVQEQHEAANEELQASNEEVQSANEELQSINEELETSKEELESANEELTTVNEEMAHRNAELHLLNSDLVNVQTSTQQAIVLLGRNLMIRRFSVQAEKQFNLLAADVGRPFSSVRHNLDVSDLDRFFTEVIDSVRAGEREVRDKDGRWFSLRVRPYFTLDNKVDGAVLVLVDISDLKRKEQAIAAAQQHAQNIIATVREPLIVLTADLRIESANRSFYDTFRVTPAETVGKFIYDLGNRQWDIPDLRTLLEKVVPENQTIDDFAVEHVFEGLGRRTMLVNGRRMHDPEHSADLILLAFEDCTERKQAGEALSRLAAIVESSRDAIVSTDLNGIVTSWNAGAERLFGYTTQEALGQAVTLILPQERFDEETDILERVRRGQIVDYDETVRRRKDGSPVAVSVTVSPIRDSRGEVVGASKIARDITERKQQEKELSEADRHKNEFLAMLAHELRNPLAPILVSIEILRRSKTLQDGEAHQLRTDTPDDPSSGSSLDLSRRVDHALDVLQRQVGQMVRLIEDLLDVGRISRGKITLRRERVELASVVHHSVEAARPLCERLKHNLTVTLPSDPVFVNADPTRLAQILGNLLNNACKFTEPGGRIWLTVERVDESRPDDAAGAPAPLVPQIVIRVRDTGVGIAPDRLNGIFDMFMQVDTSLERSLAGLGIGLTLVRTLAEMHDGTAEATSPGIGHGSEFVVRLPIVVEADTQSPQLARAEPALSPLTILIVDDNRDSAEMLAMLLKFSGHETHTAHDGMAAVEAAARLDPDVVLLDIGLPQLNGYEAARRIREQTSGSRPVLVALTGWGQDEDRRRSEEAGFDAHVVKPVDDVTLQKLLVELIGRNQTVES